MLIHNNLSVAWYHMFVLLLLKSLKLSIIVKHSVDNNMPELNKYPWLFVTKITTFIPIYGSRYYVTKLFAR